jgi:hypothetical protein
MNRQSWVQNIQEVSEKRVFKSFTARIESGVKHHNLAFYNMYVHVYTPSPHLQTQTYSFILRGRFVFKFQIRIILAVNDLKTLFSETSWIF